MVVVDMMESEGIWRVRGVCWRERCIVVIHFPYLPLPLPLPLSPFTFTFSKAELTGCTLEHHTTALSILLGKRCRGTCI